MQFDFVVSENKKILIFSDQHFGHAKDNPEKLKQTEKCVDWIIKTGKKYKVDYVFFLGDLWEHRFALSVKTMNIAIKCVEALAVNFEKLVLIVGNHDTFYKNTNEVNSLDFLKMLSRNENIEIVNNKPYYMMIHGKTFGLFPWSSDIISIINDKDFEKCDFAFGHFEANGIEMTGGVSTGSKYSIDNLYKLSDNIFSGHYHKNKLYSSLSDESHLLMVGSPMQLNWGEYNQEKYIYVLDTANNDLTEIHNEINARYEKIYYSCLENKLYTENDLTKMCKGNYVKLVIDSKYQFNTVLMYTDFIKKYEPITVELEYLISLTNDVISESTEELVKSGSKDNYAYIIDYINIIYPEIQKINDSIDKKMLLELANSYYKRSQMLEEEKEIKE